MLLALFADVHANRQAFAACLEAARGRGAERFILLGDFVGLIEQILFADIENETGEEFGFCKSLARGYTPGDLPSLVFFQDCELVSSSGC